MSGEAESHEVVRDGVAGQAVFYKISDWYPLEGVPNLDVHAGELAGAALAAADAWDAANGVHRVTLDDETVGRVTESVWPFATAHYLQAFGETRDEAQERGLRERQVIVRAVLAAAVKEGQ